MKDTVANPGYWSLGLLLASLMVAGSEWGTLTNLQTWGELFIPNNMFSFLKSLGPVLVTWFAKSAVK